MKYREDRMDCSARRRDLRCHGGESGSAETTLEWMPAELETRFAFSAAPPSPRDGASVYLLDPARGYTLSKQGGSGVT